MFLIFQIDGPTGNILLKSTSNITSLSPSITFSGSVLVSGSIIPNVDGVSTTSSFNLGSPTAAWKDIYVSNGTINFLDSAGNILQSIGTGNNQLNGNTFIFGNFTQGYNVTASGGFSHAEGQNTDATEYAAHSEGAGTLASGISSHAEGEQTTSSGQGAHSEGYYTIASGSSSHAEGQSTQALGGASHAEGNATITVGNWSHAEGHGTIAAANFQHVSGKFNISSSNENDLLIIGNGIDDNNRNNILLVNTSSMFLSGSLETTVNGEGIIMKSPNGTRYKLTVDNSGTLSVVLA